jgi:hypothetical protein
MTLFLALFRLKDLHAELLRIVRRWQPAAERAWTIESEIGVARLNPERFAGGGGVARGRNVEVVTRR